MFTLRPHIALLADKQVVRVAFYDAVVEFDNCLLLHNFLSSYPPSFPLAYEAGFQLLVVEQVQPSEPARPFCLTENPGWPRSSILNPIKTSSCCC